MRRTAISLACIFLLSASTRIDDPKTFVSEVYRRLMASRSSYNPPEDVFTSRLEKLLRDDKRKAKGEVGCLDLVFWVNAQDWTITKLSIASADQGQDQKMVTTKFLNGGEPQEIHFDFRRTAGRWLLDDVHSMSAPPWTLSEILKCSP